MLLKLVTAASVASLLMGCGAYYEDVPAFGESNPSSGNGWVSQSQLRQQQMQPVQGSVGAIGANQAQVGVDPGQGVSGETGQPQDEYADTDPSALTDFKATLDPYGTWNDDSTYGTVWQPDPGVVGADFAPYVSAGHWGYDNNDYTWVSDYDWGWAPFHYGRWVFIPGRGWSWIPGRTYAGAWVSWRVGGPGYGYVGWGPMAPTWGWRGGAPYGYGFGVNTPYTFCGTRDLFAPGLQGRIVAGPQVNTVGLGTHVYDNGNGNRTLAHPSVGGPPPSHIGAIAAPLETSGRGIAGIVHAQQFSHPSTAGSLGAHAPAYTAGAMHAQAVPNYPPQGTLGGYNHPVATGPRYNGVAPQPYRAPYQTPYRSYGTSPYGAQPYHPYSTSGSTPYRSYSAGPTYRGGGGGGSFHPSAPSSYGHSYSHSYSHGGGGGHGGHR